MYTCMYVSISYLYLLIDLALYLYRYVCIYICISMYVCIYLCLCMYVYISMSICMYLAVVFIHTAFYLSSFCGLSKFPFLLTTLCYSGHWGTSLFKPPPFMLLILSKGPWEDTDREVDSSATSLPSRLLYLLLPLSSFALLCFHSFFLQETAPVFLWYLPSIAFILKAPRFFPPTSHCPSLPAQRGTMVSLHPQTARAPLDFCLTVLQKLLSLWWPMFSGLPTPMAFFQTTLPHILCRYINSWLPASSTSWLSCCFLRASFS